MQDIVQFFPQVSAYIHWDFAGVVSSEGPYTAFDISRDARREKIYLSKQKKIAHLLGWFLMQLQKSGYFG